MSSRKAFIAGNWKMNQLQGEAADLVNAILPAVAGTDYCDVAVCPPFLSIPTVTNLARGTKLAVGAQNCHFEESGAFTGEVSPAMIRETGCTYVIVGHSERRHKFGESDEFINKKLLSLYKYQLKPILCVGETLEEREAGKLEQVVENQIRKGLMSVPGEKMMQTTIAYEPVWAIGTGKTASPEQAEEMHAFIRGLLKEFFGEEVAEAVRIQYGGSVKPANVKELMSQPDIDGALVGGASLKPEAFIPIIQFKD